jgi:hypothetical protein
MSMRIHRLAIPLAGLVAIALVSSASAEITFLNSWGGYGTGNGLFTYPVGVAVGPTGTVYVTDATENDAQYFDRTGAYLGQWNAGGEPIGIAVNSAGTVYLARTQGDSLAEFSSTGGFIASIGGSSVFSSPVGVGISPGGNVYVSEEFGNRIQEFTPFLTNITQWGTTGAALGNFNTPQFVSVSPSGNVFVADYGNNRVQVFDGAGGFENAWPVSSPTGVAVTTTGDVYVASGGTYTINKYDASGNLLASFGGYGTGNGSFTNPTGVAVKQTGEIYVADSYNYRVERLFDSDAWVSGANTFTSAAVGAGQLLGASQTISSGKILTVGGTTTINAGGTLTLAGGIFSTGTLALVGPGATFQVYDGTYSIGNLTVGAGAALQVPAGQTFNAGGSTAVNAGGTLTVNGVLLSSNVLLTGVLTGSGQIAGPLTNNSGGDVRVTAGQQLLFSSTSAHTSAGMIEAIGAPTALAQVEFAGPLANATSTGLIVAEGGANLRFDAGLTNNGSLAAAFGEANLFGNITNNSSGKITISAAANALFFGDVVQNGTLNISPGSTAVFLGAFSGSGGSTGGGTALMQGDLRPGNSPALVNFGGNLTLGAASVYHMELGGATIGLEYDSIAVSGAVGLGGTLEVDLIAGFQPSLAQQFTAMTFGSESGDFSSYAGLAVGGHLTLRHAFAGNSLILIARPAIDGDINLDGIVNGLDIADVASHWLQKGIQGDANGDGVVNGLDISLIASHWLQTAGGGAGTATVPEPPAFLLAALGSLAMLGRCSLSRD